MKRSWLILMLPAILLSVGARCTVVDPVLDGLGELCGHSTYTVATDEVGSNPNALCEVTSGSCPDLRSAINTANLCQSAGPKVVQLRAGATYTLDDTDTPPNYLRSRMRVQEARVGDVRLPRILGTVALAGEDATIERGGFEVPRNRFFHVLEGAHLTLRDLTLRGGDNGESGDGRGGAIFNEGHLELHGVLIAESRSRTGGAIHNTGTLEIHASELVDSLASTGGAVYSTSAITTDQGTVFRRNVARGAAILLDCGSDFVEEDGGCGLTTRDTTFAENSSLVAEGVVAVKNGATASFETTTFLNNRSDGGAIYIELSEVTVDRSTFTSNQGTTAASIYVLRGEIAIRRSTFHNERGRSSAAIRCAGTRGNQLVLEDGTVFENEAELSPGYAVVVEEGCFSEFSNTVVAANTPFDCGFINAPTTGGVNFDSDGSCEGFSTVVDARLGALQDNGGTTMTLLPETGSALVDAGTRCLEEDQRGRPRPQDGNGDGRTACDIGAVER